MEFNGAMVEMYIVQPLVCSRNYMTALSSDPDWIVVPKEWRC